MATSIVLFLIAVGLGYFTEAGAPEPTSFANTPAANATRGSVQSLTGDTLLIVTESGQAAFKLSTGTAVETLKPATVQSIVPGEWLNAGAIPSNANLFTIVGLTLIPQAVLPSR